MKTIRLPDHLRHRLVDLVHAEMGRDPYDVDLDLIMDYLTGNLPSVREEKPTVEQYIREMKEETW